MTSFSEKFSGEIRAHLARERKNPAELAIVVGCSYSTICRRIYENAPWPLDEAMAAAHWANIPMKIFSSKSDSSVA